nr:MAG TPA: hypothetical protein [Microviridae sp.]
MRACAFRACVRVSVIESMVCFVTSAAPTRGVDERGLP